MSLDHDAQVVLSMISTFLAAGLGIKGSVDLKVGQKNAGKLELVGMLGVMVMATVLLSSPGDQAGQSRANQALWGLLLILTPATILAVGIWWEIRRILQISIGLILALGLYDVFGWLRSGIAFEVPLSGIEFLIVGLVMLPLAYGLFALLGEMERQDSRLDLSDPGAE